MGIKGINHSMAKAICEVSGFDKFQKIGSLDESQVQKLEEVLKAPSNKPEHREYSSALDNKEVCWRKAEMPNLIFL